MRLDVHPIGDCVPVRVTFQPLAAAIFHTDCRSHSRRSPANIGRAAQSLRRGHRRSPSANPVDYVNLKLLAVRCEAATPVNVTLSFAS
jgi:hypothetical protein